MKAVLLDLFGTLFPLEPLGKHLETAGVPASALKLWFARILRDAWALEVARQYRPFREAAAGAAPGCGAPGSAAWRKTSSPRWESRTSAPTRSPSWSSSCNAPAGAVSVEQRRPAAAEREMRCFLECSC
jgi:hypothetical protein